MKNTNVPVSYNNSSRTCFGRSHSLPSQVTFPLEYLALSRIETEAIRPGFNPAIAERILKEQGLDDFIAQLKAAGAL